MPSEVDYIDLHHSALRLTLIENEVDTTLFPVYATQQIDAPGIQITASIIGASHVITYRFEDRVLNELFACITLPGDSALSLDQLQSTPVERTVGSVRYSFTATVIPWLDPEPKELVEIVTAAAAQESNLLGIGMVQDFPKGELLVTPKTVIVGSVDESKNKVTFHTAHSYPNVGGLVLSYSTLYT